MRKLLSLLALPLLFLGAGCKNGTVAVAPVTLEYWRVEDAPGSLQPAIDAYRKAHPNVTIRVTTFREEEYGRKLLEAFAEDRGPDMLSIDNVSVRQWAAQVLPLPKELSVPTPGVDAKGQPKNEIRKSKSPTKLQLEQSLVEAAAADLTIPDPQNPASPFVIGVPFSLDTIALYSNTDLLTRAKIEKPPATWQDFQAQVERLTTRTPDDTIVQSGAAIGTARNVRHATAILSALMMQNGTAMLDESGRPFFNQVPLAKRGSFPGLEALSFYRSFAVPGASQHAWGTSLPDSLDAFASGKTAFYFGLPNDARKISQANPRLRFAISAMPQIDQARPVPAALYPVEIVSRKTKHPNEAWDFLLFAASAEQVKPYLAATSRPPALRSLLADAVANPATAPFASQVLTAKSWYRGTNYEKVKDAFRIMIEAPIDDEADLSRLLDTGVSLVSETLR